MKYFILLVILLFSNCAHMTIIVPCCNEAELVRCTSSQVKKEVFITNYTKLDKCLYEVTYDEK